MTSARRDAGAARDEPHFLRNLLLFGRGLQHAGLPVQAGSLRDLVEALRHIHLGDRDEVYHACRALLVHRREHLAIFDRVFAAFWSAEDAKRPDRRNAAEAQSESSEHEVSAGGPGGAENTEGANSPPGAGERHDLLTPTTGIKVWSDRGGQADKDFALFTADEIEEAHRILSQLLWDPGRRRTRRWVRGRGRRIDLRRAIAVSLRTGGEVVALPRRRRRVRSRTVVLVCDVSASMERYTRMLLHFAHALNGVHHRVEVFLFATQLTRITAELRQSRPDEAVSAVTQSVHDWSGGTRIGAAIRQLHRKWGMRVLAARPVVLLISDGWDCGDPRELRTQMARLQRRCHRLVWLNPLLGTTDYAPLTRGLQAALPYVDDFLPARTLTNLADLALQLNALAPSSRGNVPRPRR